MRTLGVDMASQPRATAACVLRWDRKVTVEFIACNLDDDAIVARCKEADHVGIDAPLGWPAPFVEFVSRQARGEPVDGPWTDARRDTLRLRATDRFVLAHTRLRPLSVSSDLIGVPAMRTAMLLSRLGVTRRDGSEGLHEVYPACALKVWGLPHRGYKGTDRQAQRRAILDALAANLTKLELDDETVNACLRWDHCLDALVSSLATRAGALGRAHAPPSEEASLAVREGWIVVPNATVDTLPQA